MNCIECNKKIPRARLDALPETQTCVRCSKEEKRIGITIWDKTTPELIMVNGDEARRLWHLERQRAIPGLINKPRLSEIDKE